MKQKICQLLKILVLDTKWSKTDYPDSLRISGFLAFGIEKSVLAKIVIAIMFLLHGSITSVYIWDLLKTFDSNLLIQYGPYTCAGFTATIGGITALLLEDPMVKLAEEILGATAEVEYIDDETRQKTEDKARVVNCSVTIAIILVILLALLYSPLGGQGNDVFYALCRWKSKYFITIFYATLLPGIYCMISNAISLIYITTLLSFHLYKMNEYMANIDSEFDEIQDDILIGNGHFQDVISTRLKFWIGRHQFLTKIVERLNKLLLIPLCIVWLMTLLMLVGLCFLLIMRGDTIYQPRPLATFIVASVIILLAFHSGQALVSDSSLLFQTIWETRWRCYNKKNRKTLILLQEITQRPLFLGDSMLFMTDYANLLKGLKFLISLIAFLYQVVRPDQNK